MMQQQLQIFWVEQYREIEATTDFKNHNLIASIKKIMKATEENKRHMLQKSNIVAVVACTRRMGGVGQHPRSIFGGLLEIVKNRCSISKPMSTYFKV
jgi:hypothetical protein